MFHPNDPNLILSGSQDGYMKVFDLRASEAVANFSSGQMANTASTYDVHFCPLFPVYFSSVCDTGRVSIWDMRRADRAEKSWAGHAEYVFACRWHPEVI